MNSAIRAGLQAHVSSRNALSKLAYRGFRDDFPNVYSQHLVSSFEAAASALKNCRRRCRTGSNAYIGPYTAIGDRCQISSSEIDDSIVMEGSTISVERKIARSMTGKESTILNANGLMPKGERLVVGENTTIHL